MVHLLGWCVMTMATAFQEYKSASSEVVCNMITDYDIKVSPSDQTAEIRAAIADCRRRALAHGPDTRAVVLFPGANEA